MHKKFLLGLVFLVLTGCTTTQNAATIGGLGGAALGGIIGHQSGHGVEGAAIGAAAGAIGGVVVGEHIKKEKFCPEDGEVFDASLKFCPTHGVELKDKAN